MRIRSITYFFNPGWPLDENAFQRAGEFLREARAAYTGAGFEVQTVRLATIPFPDILGLAHLPEAVAFSQAVEQAASSQGIDFVSIGPAFPDQIASYAMIPEILLATQNVFVSGSMTAPRSFVSLPAVRACAQIIFQAARIAPDGFGNLRFTALGNVPAGSPFFPAAYHSAPTPTFAIATEAADLAVEAFVSAFSLDQARQGLVEAVNQCARELSRVGTELAVHQSTRFGGIDFTLAPFPEQQRSLGYAVERLGVPAIGMAGSLAAAALLADCLDRADFPRTGFSGLMFPVLEDATLAMRAAEGLLTVNDLLLYSCVCGTGLDTVPLPGDS
ncbi:MAG: DUF711 family protein, partial [Anaerolineaceae bacterium]|nr:DUF711 family protein [Anaerolineaceae bacterium]